MSSKSSKSSKTREIVHGHDLDNLDNLCKKDYIKLLDNLCLDYYNGTGYVDDETYDSAKEMFEIKFGELYEKIGAPVVGSQQKKKLPKFMGSLNKIKDRKSLDNWKKTYKGPYVITDKIDGVSCLQHKNNLYTRGDGIIGTDISHLASIISVPKNINDVFARMEIVMPKDKFEEKYGDDTANPRNMVSGLVNRKNVNPKIANDLLILAYEYDNGMKIKQSDQFEKLEQLGYTIPNKTLVKTSEDLTIEMLQKLLTERKKNANYDIDGLVIVSDIPYTPIVGENPKNAIAFKMEGECVSTIVEEVQWNVSKHGLLKPRVRVVPVNLCGVTITWFTGFNARFILDNNICKGCTIEGTRSGDVIPYIKDIIIPGDHADMPSEDYEWSKKKYMVTKKELEDYGRSEDDSELILETHGNEKYYVWYDDSEVDIRIKGENDDMKIKKIISFFKKLEAKFVGESTIQKLYEHGYKTLNDIFNLSVDDICKIDGFKNKGATRIVEAIHSSITDVPLAKIAAASGVMGVGIGEKKFQLVVDKHPDIMEFDIPLSEMTDIIKEVGGFDKLAVHFASKLSILKVFLEEHPEISLKKEKKYEKKKRGSSVTIVFEDSDGEENESEDSEDSEEEENFNDLDGKTIVFTGFRSKEAEEKIKRCGGKVTTSVSKKTNLLVVAQRYITGEEFMKKYIEERD